jgi:hypothetical protein
LILSKALLKSRRSRTETILRLIDSRKSLETFSKAVVVRNYETLTKPIKQTMHTKIMSELTNRSTSFEMHGRMLMGLRSSNSRTSLFLGIGVSTLFFQCLEKHDVEREQFTKCVKVSITYSITNFRNFKDTSSNPQASGSSEAKARLFYVFKSLKIVKSLEIE